VLTRQESAGKWTAATYALTEAVPMDATGHRTHRTNGADGAASVTPIRPMGPMSDAPDGDVAPGTEAEI
jgi:hypothetical protein